MDVAARLAYFAHVKLTSLEAQRSGCRSSVTEREIRWLALFAFMSVMQRKQSRYKKLLIALSHELVHPRWNGLKLSHAVDLSRYCDIYENILF